MIRDGADPESITDQQADGVLARVNAYRLAKQPPMAIHRIAKAIGCSNSVLSQVLNKRYPGDFRSVVIDLDQWLESQLKRDASPEVATFVWTSVAREIMTVAKVAATAKKIALVYGPETSGIGKTLALKAIAAEMAGSVMITITQTNRSIGTLLQTICRAAKLDDSGSFDAKMQRIVRLFDGTPRLLIIDQIHNLCGGKNDKAFYLLTDIYDATGAPQLWCGTSDINAYLDRGQQRGADPLAQIQRRMIMCRDLMQRTLPRGDGGRGEPLFTLDEIRKVFGRHQLKLATDAQDYLYKLANLPNSGALGTCVDLVVLTTAVEEAKGTKMITAQMLKDVHRGLRKWRHYELLQARLDEDQGGMRAAKVG